MPTLYPTKFIPVACALVAMAVGGYRRKAFDRPSRIYWYYTCVGFIAEALARSAAIIYGNNMPVYAVYSLIELLIISLYFNYSIEALASKNIGWYIGVLGLLIGIMNIVLFQPLKAFNSYFLYFEGVVIISLSFYSFYRLVLLSDDLRLANLRHFWFPFILCSFWTITFLNWGLYEYFNSHLKEWTWLINLSINLISGLTYLAIAFVFWCYPKLKATDE